MIDYKKLIDKYDANIQEQQELDDSLFETSDKGSWSNFLIRRATRLQEINKENTNIIKKITDAISGDITKEEADTLFNCAMDFVNTGLCDAELHLPILKKLNYYYCNTENNIKKRIAVLYYISYVEDTLLYKAGATESSNEVYPKVLLSFIDHYAEIDDVNVRSFFLMTYYNLAVANNDSRDYYDESYKWYMECMDFINSDTFKDIEKDSEFIPQWIDMFKRHWLSFTFFPEDINRPVYKKFKEETESFYSNLIASNEENLAPYFQYVYAHLIVRIVEGEISFSEATYQFYEIYKRIIEVAESRDDLEFISYVVLPASSCITELAYNIDNIRQRKSYFDLIYDSLMKIKGLAQKDTAYNSDINSTLSSLCIKTMSCMNNKAEKEDKLFNLVIKRQVATYIHSNMVANLSKIITDEAYSINPQLFKDLGMNYNQIMHYTEQAALLHDLGKIKITEIVNMQRRQLGEEEFIGVRRHPKNGEEIVKLDSDLSIYSDVMLGHHKFYDGDGGYPADFDNTKSKYKIIIDIITIADCLDAATDSYSRNYKESKSFEQVLNEFQAEAGTRYNPYIVRIINDSPGLKYRLKKITMKYRLDMMYEAYSSGRDKYI